MNEAHLHLIFNHFPLIGTLFGFGIIVFGMVKKNTTIIQTALVVLLISSLMAIPTMMTGEGAEEIVEKLGVSHDVIHEHEELAEKFIWLSRLMGILAIAALVLIKKSHKKAMLVISITVLVALINVIIGAFVGTSGGEIRHTEIRSNTPQQEIIK